MWATLILPLATTFKAPACLEFVARHVGTGLAAAFQTLTPRVDPLDQKAYQNTQKPSDAPIETPEMLEAANQVRIQMMRPDEAGALY